MSGEAATLARLLGIAVVLVAPFAVVAARRRGYLRFGSRAAMPSRSSDGDSSDRLDDDVTTSQVGALADPAVVDLRVAIQRVESAAGGSLRIELGARCELDGLGLPPSTARQLLDDYARRAGALGLRWEVRDDGSATCTIVLPDRAV